MSEYGQWGLQKVIYEALTGDSALMTQVSAVYDRVPAQPEYPFITIGEAGGRDWSSKTFQGQQFLSVLHVYSRAGGRKEAVRILESLHAVLHDTSLSVPGFSVPLIRYQSSDVMLEGDGLTYHGIIRFRVLIHLL